jgi:enoyl-CoA hydratase/carnithine racemase
MDRTFGEPGKGLAVRIEDEIGDVRLDRPDKLNALDSAMFDHIAECIQWLQGQEALRCVVLSGEGRSFCAGLDLSVLQTGLGPLASRSHGIANRAQFCAWGWRELPVPVIAVIQGHCFGAGIQIALGADIRISTPDAQLSIMEMRHGLVPDMGAYVLSRGVIREDIMRELVYTARRVTGEEAQGLGLVTRVADDPLVAAQELAREIAGQSPSGIRAAKRLFRQMADGEPATILQAESDEEERLVTSLRGPRT